VALARFYPIFPAVSWLQRLLPHGIRLVQLRIKDSGDRALREPKGMGQEIRQARALCHAFGCQLVVNDYWQLAIEEGCDFVHLGQEDLDSADLEALRRAGIRLGVSTHDEAELDRALALQPDYIALGPIYPTRLKQMKWAPQGLERVTLWKRRIGATPLVAIGGLDIERAGAAIAAGADIVSVVTDITLHPNPELRVAEWAGATARAS
jgi:thiamine-phosphate pyrophosphorylase